MTTPPTPQPAHLYLRIAGKRLGIVRYEEEQPARIATASYHLNPQMSLVANLREAYGKEPLLRAPASGCVEVMVSAPVTVAPLADFQEENCAAIYAFCFPGEEHVHVFYDIVAAADCVVHFALKEASCRALEDFYESVHYTSGFTPLIRHCVAKGTDLPCERRFFVYVHDRRADLMAFSGQALLIVNSYAIDGMADVAYYVTDVARQYNGRLSAADFKDPAMAPAGTEAYDAVYVMADGQDTLDAAVCELRQFALNVRKVSAPAEFNRHVAATSPDVSYDLLTLLLDNP